MGGGAESKTGVLPRHGPDSRSGFFAGRHLVVGFGLFADRNLMACRRVVFITMVVDGGKAAAVEAAAFFVLFSEKGKNPKKVFGEWGAGCYIRILHLRRQRRRVGKEPERVMLFDFIDRRESQVSDARPGIFV